MKKMTAETSSARGEWVLVPRNPTEAMIDAWRDAPNIWEDAYAAMLAAAPPPADAEPKTLPVPTRVYLTDKAAVIVGDPQCGWDEEAPGAHNCDAMGCASIGPHVLARVPFTDERAMSQPAEARGDVRGLVSLAQRVQYADTHAQVSKDDAGEFICLPPWLWLEIRDAAAEALTAAQQQGQAVAFDFERARTLIDYVVGYARAAELKSLSSDACVALRDLHTMLHTAPPPSAPVGVDLDNWARHYSIGPAALEALRNLLTLAQQPAAVDEVMVVGQRVEWQNNFGDWLPAVIVGVNPATYNAKLDDGCDATQYPRSRFRLATQHQEPKS